MMQIPKVPRLLPATTMTSMLLRCKDCGAHGLDAHCYFIVNYPPEIPKFLCFNCCMKRGLLKE